MKINLKDAFLLDRYEKDISLKLQAGTDPDLASLASFPEDPSVHFFIRHGLLRYGDRPGIFQLLQPLPSTGNR